MSIRSFPTLAIDLVRDVAEMYPPRCIQPGESIEDHLRYAGQVDLAVYLQEWLDAASKVKD